MMAADVQTLGGKRYSFTARMNDAAVEYVSLHVNCVNHSINCI